MAQLVLGSRPASAPRPASSAGTRPRSQPRSPRRTQPSTGVGGRPMRRAPAPRRCRLRLPLSSSAAESPSLPRSRQTYYLMQFSETKALGDAVGFGSAFLFASVFGTRLYNTRKLVPSGLLSALSLGALGVFYAAYLQDKV
nr:uncharacterized protein LOC109751932 [Aegilops tauschii subsp. strangulata]